MKNMKLCPGESLLLVRLRDDLDLIREALTRRKFRRAARETLVASWRAHLIPTAADPILPAHASALRVLARHLYLQALHLSTESSLRRREDQFLFATIWGLDQISGLLGQACDPPVISLTRFTFDAIALDPQAGEDPLLASPLCLVSAGPGAGLCILKPGHQGDHHPSRIRLRPTWTVPPAAPLAPNLHRTPIGPDLPSGPIV